MKPCATVFVVCLLSLAPALSQNADEIRREANPEYVEVADNSPASQLWRAIVAAKQSGNESLHASLVRQFTVRFPERFSVISPTENAPSGIHVHQQPPEPGDWGTGDVRINPSPILIPTGIVSGRSLQLEVDSLGNKYAAYIIGSGDTLLVHKSTDQGLTWSRINEAVAGLGFKWQSFDFFITDSANRFKLGFAAVRARAGYAGQIYWITMNDDGTGFRSTQVQSQPTGRGLINPAIVSDGFVKSSATTYWYMVYQNVDSASGVCNAAVTALSMDWGATWMLDSARSTFNDYDLDIDYNYNADSLVVLLTNDLAATNPNLRLRKIGLANYSTGTWVQFNPANTASPEDQGCLVMNRQTNEVLVTYTLTSGSDKNISYAYNPAGAGWTLGAVLTALPNNETRARADCQERQGAYRVSYVSTGTSYDTVVYYATTSLAAGFAGRQVVNQQASASAAIYPDVAGFRTGVSSFGGGVVFAGAGSIGAYYDGSNIAPTSVRSIGDSKPTAFSLEQNYPNPFNPATTIKFSLPSAGHVALIVYDILGNEVATLVNEHLQSGNYLTTFHASHIASGTYFYRLQSGTRVQTKKFVVVK